MNLIVAEEFISHAGRLLDFKIECDAFCVPATQALTATGFGERLVGVDSSHRHYRVDVLESVVGGIEGGL